MNNPKKNLTVLLALSILLPAYIATASVPLGAARKAPGGQSDIYGCMQSNEYYIVNFAAYQTGGGNPKEDKTTPVAECIELPAIGPTIVTLDLLDRDVRRKPVALKVSNGGGQVIAEMPMNIEKSGVLTMRVNFVNPGKYEVVLFVNDNDLKLPIEKSALHIPLSVAMVHNAPAPKTGLTFFFLAMGGLVLGLGWWMPRLLKITQTKPVSSL